MPVPDDERSTHDESPALSFLEGLAEETRKAVIGRATMVRLQAGDWLFRAGEPADSMYVVRSGKLEVLGEAGRGRPPRLMRVLGPGDALGELAVLTASTRSASVQARRDTVLWRLAAADFERLLREDPSLTLAITRFLGRLLVDAAAGAAGQASPAVLAVVSPRPSVAVAELLTQMVSATEAIVGPGRVAVLTAENIARDARAQTGQSEPASEAAYSRLLEVSERQHDVVLLSAGALLGPPDASAWTRFCLRSADRLVLVVDGDGSRPLPPDAAPQLPAELDLCFLGTPFEGSVAGWLETLRPARHHIVRLGSAGGNPSDVGRMMRRITGGSVGLVLSGGGARGFAHLGVLDALQQAGIVVDRVGGCSMGSIIAALAAQERPLDQMVAACRHFFVDAKPLNDYTIPRTALVRGKKLNALLEAAFGPETIETLPMDYFCVSADLVRAETVVHRRGPLWRALRASVSIPGLLPPVRAGDRLLIDGGVLDNLPIDVMAAAQDGPIIAVDVMRGFQTGRRHSTDEMTRMSRIRHRARRHSAEPSLSLPPIAETLTRATVLGSWRHTEAYRTRATLLVTLPADDTGILAFDQLDRLVEAGRRAAAAALEESELPARLRGAPGRSMPRP